MREMSLNNEYQMTLDEFLDRFEYFAQAIEAVDEAARKVFKLAAFSWNDGLLLTRT